MDKKLAPIIVFTYKRLDTLHKTISSLQLNALASESLVYIFSDAAKSINDEAPVNEVRKYLHTIAGFKEVNIIERESNMGLANSIITGVSKIINEYGKAIVVEDDLLLAPNFLMFMNRALDFYERNLKVYSISGYIFNIKPNNDIPYDVFFIKRHCSWGWAMWKDRWNEIDWDVEDFNEFKNSKLKQRAFNGIGSDLSSSLTRQMNGEINSWAIRCVYNQFKKQTYTVYPLKSKVINLGFGAGATHTVKRLNQYKAALDNELKYKFNFSEDIFEDKIFIKRFKNKYSMSTRLWFYLLNKFIK